MEPQRQASSPQPQEGVGWGDGTATPSYQQKCKAAGWTYRGVLGQQQLRHHVSPGAAGRAHPRSATTISRVPRQWGATASPAVEASKTPHHMPSHHLPPTPPRNYHSPGLPHLHGNSHPFSVHGNTPQAGMSSSQSTPPAGILTPPAASETLAPLQRSESISRRSSSGSMLGDSLYKDELQQMQRLVSVAQSRCGWVGG